MRNIFLLVVVVFLAVGCSKKEEKPKNLVSKETMVQVIADMHVAEAKVKNLRVTTDSARQLYSIYELLIFEKLGISTDQYLESYDYYLNHPKEMTAISTAVLDTLQKRQEKLKK